MNLNNRYLLYLSLFYFIVYELNGVGMNFTLKSTSFENGKEIPKKYSCDGQNVSPNLSWQNVPVGAKNLVLVVDDPDAQKVVGKTFVHWIVLNIDPEMNEIPEGIKFQSKISNLAKEFQNDFHQLKYGGVCPPQGEHTYCFTLFALDKNIELTPEMTPDFFRDSYNQSSDFYKRFKSHILGFAQIMGKYKRQS
ncbi:MAG: YbhB/YbcL family Raf kinase inhibitor-like protein [Candidatus Babeliales bacterium]|nr:YbhB/YbcL family Raf kinase inhibitor-like protein [Candidatus Babeliales bacterium]